jgi:hypothetical protein
VAPFSFSGIIFNGIRVDRKAERNDKETKEGRCSDDVYSERREKLIKYR